MSKSFGTGVFYTAISKYGRIFISIVIGAILARLLSPEEFGVVALVTVFVTFFNLLSDVGIGPAIVQNQDLNQTDIQSIFSFSIIIGFIFSVLFFLAAPLLADFYNQPELVTVARLLAISILFYSWQIVPKALLQKSFKFKQVGIVVLSVQLLSGSVAILLAFRNFSYYALVVKSIMDGGLMLVAFLLLAKMKGIFILNKTGILKIIRFSTFQFMFNFINYFSRNLDNILIGRFLGASALGFYDKSYRLMLLPVQNLTHVITPVLLPILSRYHDDKDFVFDKYLKIIKILSFIGFPLSVFLYFSAEEIVFILYGEQWGSSIPVFKLLSLTVGIQMILSSVGSIFQVVNRTDLLFFSGVISAIVLVGGILYGLFIGGNIEKVGVGLVIAFIINFFIGFFVLIKIGLNNSFIVFLKTLRLAVFVSLCVASILFLADSFSIKNYIISLISNILLTGVVLVLFFSFNRKLKMEMKILFSSLRKK